VLWKSTKHKGVNVKIVEAMHSGKLLIEWEDYYLKDQQRIVNVNAGEMIVVMKASEFQRFKKQL
jgi:hypothetical protein